MKFFRHTLILLFSTISLFAQNQSVSLRGRVVDSADNTPVEFADVIIYGTDGRILTSGTTGADGFEVKGIRADSISVTVRMIGYEPHLSEPFAVTAGEVKDLGTIALKKQSLDIREVTVVADKNQIVYKLDRRTISASSSLTASGGTALDILANVPSVQIDADGELTLRGSSGYLVYVNGKPSPLDGSEALRQIPASSIEDIELITTPSARYKSDGDVGIINIKTSGPSSDMFGGNVNLSGSTLGTWSADGRLNFHKGNHTVYAGGTLQDIKSKGDFRQDKITDIDSCRVESHSDGERFRSSRTLVGNAGWQFDDGKRHKFILDLQAGSTRNHRGGDMLYNESRNYMEEAPGMGTLRPESGIFNSEDHYILEKKLLQASLDYIWKISPRGEINASSRLRYDRYSLEYTESNMFTLEGVRDEGTRGYEREHHWDADGAVNYKLEFGSAGKLETGYQYTTYSEHGNYSFKYWDKAVGDFIWDESMNTPFYYRRQNHTLYAMVTEKIGKLDFDAGLRAERVIDEMTIDIKDASRYVKLWDLFPSAHISYDASSAGSLSLGYSRRTNRPGIWQREPNITYEDYYTRKVGNPDIKAEYINSVELGYRKLFTKAGSIAATLFWRHRADVVDWIRLPYQKGVTLDKIVNAGNQNEYGLEFSTQFKPLKWWSTTVNGDIYRFDFKATRNDCHDADGFNYMFGWINHFHVAKNTGIQFDGHFIGPHVLTQGDEKAYCYFDLAAKQQFADGKIALSLVIHDIFHTAVYENFRSTAGLESRTVVRPKFPNILLGITFRFNTTPAKEKGGAITGEAGFEGKEF
ncbi:MAG: TonB-dependent receptor [Alistipes sp.]|nr:TonB-dependent receptor [Candidatus Minthomonas equi]